MKKNKTYVSAAAIETILIKMGCKYEEQKGFIKVELPGAPGRRIYVGRTVAVGRVDISGFELPADCEGIVHLGGDSFGAVKQQVDFSSSRTEAQILDTIEWVIAYGSSLGKAPPREKKGGTSASPDGKTYTGWMSAEQRAKVAAEMGVNVSDNAPARTEEAA